MIECLSTPQLVQFLSLIPDIVESVDVNTYLVKAETGNIYWVWDSPRSLWCTPG